MEPHPFSVVLIRYNFFYYTVYASQSCFGSSFQQEIFAIAIKIKPVVKTDPVCKKALQRHIVGLYES